MTISEAFERYRLEVIILGGMSQKTSTNYISICNSLTAAVGDIAISILDQHQVTRWKLHMMNRGNSTSSMASSLTALRKVLKFIKSVGGEVMDYDNIDLPKVRPKPPTFVLSDEVSRLITVADNLRDKAIIASLFSTGCRITELLSIRRDEYNGDEVMVTGKNGSYRPVYLDETARKYLDLYLDSRTDKMQALFVSAQRRRITPSRVCQILHSCADRAGLDKNIHPHAFRMVWLPTYL